VLARPRTFSFSIPNTRLRRAMLKGAPTQVPGEIAPGLPMCPGRQTDPAQQNRNEDLVSEWLRDPRGPRAVVNKHFLSADLTRLPRPKPCVSEFLSRKTPHDWKERSYDSNGLNLRLEMFVVFRFYLVVRARTLMCALAASHRWAHCALMSAPALRHNRRQASATASLHWRSSP
jgi:hypothetical protein